MKYIKIAFGILFTIFAILQYNDPDPWLWITIYMSVASIMFFDASGENVKKPYLVTLVLLGILSLAYIPGLIDYIQAGNPGELVEEMKVTKPYVEETREFGGLLMVILVVLWFRSS